MAYVTGSVTNSSPGPLLYAAMQPALTTAGFTLVDTVVISTRTHQVWKSAAANNIAGLDWYLDVGYPTTGITGGLNLQCFESYDPATDLGYRGLFTGVSSTIIDPTTYSRFGATGSALETNWVGASGFTSYPLLVATTAMTYYFSVTTNRVIALLTTDSYVAYVGLYSPDPLYAAKAGAAMYPLVGMRYSGASAGSGSTPSSSYAALTRAAPASALVGAGWGTIVFVSPRSGAAVSLPGGSTEMYPYTATPLQIGGGGGSPTVVYGSPYDMAVVASSTSVGNTVTCDGSTWVLANASSGYSVMFRTV